MSVWTFDCVVWNVMDITEWIFQLTRTCCAWAMKLVFLLLMPFISKYTMIFIQPRLKFDIYYTLNGNICFCVNILLEKDALFLRYFGCTHWLRFTFNNSYFIFHHQSASKLCNHQKYSLFLRGGNSYTHCLKLCKYIHCITWLRFAFYPALVVNSSTYCFETRHKLLNQFNTSLF